MKRSVLTDNRVMLAPDGAEGGFEIVEQPTEQVQFEFEDSPDGLTSEERAAQAAQQTAGSNPPEEKGGVVGLEALVAALGARKEEKPEEDGPKLAQVLDKMTQVIEQQGQPKAAVKTMEALQEEVKELWYTDPLKAQMKVLEFYEQTRLAPAVGQLQQTINQQREEIAQLRGRSETAELMTNPRAKFALEKYGKEVEQVAMGYKGQPDALRRAAQEVSLRHDDEYLEAWMSQREAGKVSARGPAAMAAPPVPAGNVGPVAKKVAWTREMEHERLVMGLTKEDYIMSVEKGWIADPRKRK